VWGKTKRAALSFGRQDARQTGLQDVSSRMPQSFMQSRKLSDWLRRSNTGSPSSLTRSFLLFGLDSGLFDAVHVGGRTASPANRQPTFVKSPCSRSHFECLCNQSPICCTPPFASGRKYWVHVVWRERQDTNVPPPQDLNPRLQDFHQARSAKILPFSCISWP
jgi:hypothetical protein